MAPARWTLGPSRPRLAPPPTLRIPATNLTQTTRAGTKPKSFQNASFSCGTPLPAASRQNESNSQPTASEELTNTTKLPTKNVPMDSCDSRWMPFW